jgi:hypothetical protein
MSAFALTAIAFLLKYTQHLEEDRVMGRLNSSATSTLCGRCFEATDSSDPLLLPSPPLLLPSSSLSLTHRHLPGVTLGCWMAIVEVSAERG